MFEQHKKGIEEMFKPIKATLTTTDDNQTRCLTGPQQEWYQIIFANTDKKLD